MMKKILFATSEVYPLVKTGGLGDVSAGLPMALRDLDQDVVIVLPAYREALERATVCECVATLDVLSCGNQRQVQVFRAQADGLSCPLLLVKIDTLFDRSGSPYQDSDGNDWWDNGERFGLFAKIVTELACDRLGLNWRPDVVHCNDWQTGLVPALLQLETEPALTVFTIHNLAYGGHFPHELFVGLDLPPSWWHFEQIEFHGGMSMLKAGIVFADHVTTVSPSYAQEICTPELGCGLHGALQQRQQQGRLYGFINGIDTNVWNPQKDPYLSYNYSLKRGRVAKKERNKRALLEQLNCEKSDAVCAAPLFGFVGRMVEQKGIDLICDVIPDFIQQTDACFVVIGSGQEILEQAVIELAQRFPQRVFVHIGYSEALAHLVEAGADLFLMPSRFEPCGLNQMYSLAYGTPAIVHATGGLKDTVVDTCNESLENLSATGFVFQSDTAEALQHAMLRAIDLYRRPRAWQKLQKIGMSQDFSWQSSAQSYLDLYLHGGSDDYSATR
jgi:starch synthase